MPQVRLKGLLLVFVAGLVASAVYHSVAPSAEPAARTTAALAGNPPAPTGTVRPNMASVVCKRAIEARLKAPSTADLVELSVNEAMPDRSPSVAADEAYNVHYQVDAQNSYGAKLRDKAVCFVSYFARRDSFEVTHVGFFDPSLGLHRLAPAAPAVVKQPKRSGFTVEDAAAIDKFLAPFKTKTGRPLRLLLDEYGMKIYEVAVTPVEVFSMPRPHDQAGDWHVSIAMKNRPGRKLPCGMADEQQAGREADAELIRRGETFLPEPEGEDALLHWAATGKCLGSGK